MPNTKKPPNPIKTKVLPFSLGCLTSFFGILFSYIVIFFIGIAIAFVTGGFDQKKCQDTGYCAGHTKFTTDEGKEIEINKKTCLENKGEWFKKERVCVFKNNN